MIAEKNINALLSQWKERLGKDDYSDGYKCALGECVYDLMITLDKIKEEEKANLEEIIANLPSKEVEDYLMGLEADEELSRMDAHESVA